MGSDNMKENKWIKVSDCLPPKDSDFPEHFTEDCIATDGEKLYVGSFEDGRFYGHIIGCTNTRHFDSITHWMALPELPEDERMNCEDCKYFESFNGVCCNPDSPHCADMPWQYGIDGCKEGEAKDDN